MRGTDALKGAARRRWGLGVPARPRRRGDGDRHRGRVAGDGAPEDLEGRWRIGQGTPARPSKGEGYSVGVGPAARGSRPMAKRRDVWSLKIMAWEGHEVESAALAAELIAGPCATLVIDPMMGLVLHADNGGPMTGSTMVATVERLRLLPPFSRPSVHNDTPPPPPR